MCWCILTHGSNQEGPSQTICMFVKLGIPFDSTVGSFSCVLVSFDCLKVPSTLTPYVTSLLYCWLSDGGVTWTAHRGSGTVADGCSRDLAVRWGWVLEGVGVETPEM